MCILCIQQVVEEFFGKKFNKGVNLDEVVVIGVFIQGGVFSGDVQDVFLFDVMLFLLGIEIMGGVYDVVIEFNLIILIKKLKIYFIVVDNQLSVEIYVLQGECLMVKDNCIVGCFILDGILLVLCGVFQIEVIFDMDVNGILMVVFKDKGIGKEQFICIEVFIGFFQEEIVCMKVEVEVNVDEDKKVKECIEKMNVVDNLVF